jgi:hypothetical protein
MELNSNMDNMTSIIGLNRHMTKIKWVFLIPILVCPVMSQSPNAIDERTIGPNSRPLALAAEILSDLSSKPVTYEDAILKWNGDNEVLTLRDGSIQHIPKKKTFELPIDISQEEPLELSNILLNKVLESYNRTNSSLFDVIASSWGYHIVPKSVRDANGKYEQPIRLMDTIIFVPIEKRSPLAHLKAICDAVNISSGSDMKLKYFTPWLNQYFVSGFPRSGYSDEDIQRISFPWGVSICNARDALINLLQYSSTTLRWNVLCIYEEGSCTINMAPLQSISITSDGRKEKIPIFYDRKAARPLR